MIVKSIEEAMMKVRLGGEIKKDVVEEEQSAVQSKEELFTLSIRCKEPRRLGSFYFVILQYRKRDVMKIDREKYNFVYTSCIEKYESGEGIRWIFRSIKT